MDKLLAHPDVCSVGEVGAISEIIARARFEEAWRGVPRASTQNDFICPHNPRDLHCKVSAQRHHRGKLLPYIVHKWSASLGMIGYFLGRGSVPTHLTPGSKIIRV